MRQQTQVFAHQFSSMENLPFAAEDYSKLKFGSDAVARRFGKELAFKFFAEHAAELLTQNCVVIPSPYNFVENAATVMARHFTNELNHLLVNANGTNVEWSIIHRKVSYTNDYGFLTKDKRRELIDNDLFFLNKEFLEGKTLIFVDDVCITGTHEDKLIEILDKNRLTNRTFFAYFGKYEKGEVGADIEAQLNFAGIQHVSDFVQLSKQPDHHLIVRPIKFMLSQKPEVFRAVIKDLDDSFARKMYYGCVGEGYNRIPKYQDNFQQLMHHLCLKD